MIRLLIPVFLLLATPFPFLEEPFTSWSLDEAVAVGAVVLLDDFLVLGQAALPIAVA